MNSERIICYGKTTEKGDNAIVTAVNLDPRHAQSGRVEVDLGALGIGPRPPYQMHELSPARAILERRAELREPDPQHAPAHIVSLRRRVRGERDFDYFL